MLRLSILFCFISSCLPAQTIPTLYWGALQIRVTDKPDSAGYSGNARLNPETFREVIRREPRWWTGKEMLQLLQFNLNGLPIASDRKNYAVYDSSRFLLDSLAAELQPTDRLELSALPLSDGRSLRFLITLDGPTPAWMRSRSAPISGNSNLSMRSILNQDINVSWGRELEDAADFPYVTADKFWLVVAQQPMLQLTDKEAIRVEEVRMEVFQQARNLIREMYPAYDRWMRVDEMRSLLYQFFDQIQAGNVSVRITTHDPRPARDTFFMLDNKKFQVGPLHLHLLSADIVQPDDERLSFRRSQLKEYMLEWGDYSLFLGMQYGRKTSSGKQPASFFNNYRMEVATTDDLLRSLRMRPRLYENNKWLKKTAFMLTYRDRQVFITDYVPNDLLEYIKQTCTPNDIVQLSELQAGEVKLEGTVVFEFTK